MPPSQTYLLNTVRNPNCTPTTMRVTIRVAWVYSLIQYMNSMPKLVVSNGCEVVVPSFSSFMEKIIHASIKCYIMRPWLNAPYRSCVSRLLSPSTIIQGFNTINPSTRQLTRMKGWGCAMVLHTLRTLQNSVNTSLNFL